MAQSSSEGFKSREEGKKKCNTQQRQDLRSIVNASEISRLVPSLPSLEFSRDYPPSLFCMVTVYIIYYC